MRNDRKRLSKLIAQNCMIFLESVARLVRRDAARGFVEADVPGAPPPEAHRELRPPPDGHVRHQGDPAHHRTISQEAGNQAAPAANRLHGKGPSIKDVRSKLGLFDPLPPLSEQ